MNGGASGGSADNGAEIGDCQAGMGDYKMTRRTSGAGNEPITTLRGATVDVDAGRVGLAVAGICLLALVATIVVLFVVGIQKNAQVDLLRHRGVPVEVTVSGCLGLMGGSGSNLAGYDCRATFLLAGHRYSDAVPGSELYSPGARLKAIVVPEDPALLSTPRAMASEHASGRVFVLPSALLVALALAAGWLSVKRKMASASFSQIRPAHWNGVLEHLGRRRGRMRSNASDGIKTWWR